MTKRLDEEFCREQFQKLLQGKFREADTARYARGCGLSRATLGGTRSLGLIHGSAE